MSDFFTLMASDPEFERGGIRHVTVKSKMLGHRADITLHVPPEAKQEQNIPLVLLLHGIYSSHWSWVYHGGVDKIFTRLISLNEVPPMVLVMPSDGLWGDGSGYLPHPKHNFEGWICEDVVQATIEVVDGVTEASPLFISGLSMGGYGALRLAAKYPQRFRGCSAHSSVTEFEQLNPLSEKSLDNYPVHGDETSILHYMKLNKSALPPIRFDCGTDDELLTANRQLHQAMLRAEIPHSYEEFPGGHDWKYWGEHVEKTLKFFGGLL
ncbi:MAG: alpha/beta hydrolase-fold protein [Calditrichota bacterium]